MKIIINDQERELNVPELYMKVPAHLLKYDLSYSFS
jgi:hypothetical protein